MFYSVFVLGKKGPLARVWLAAHWDKKITKAQILETNIVESVDSILQPKVKLSLRTSSHLLLGIVRIYARKTLYLLQDCQDAAFKIKSAFRPGAVDLPDGKTEAAISAITLPEMLDFINDFDLIAEPPIQMEPPATSANIRSITLVEDISSIHVDDPLMNEVREWSDISSVHGPDGSVSLKDGSSLHIGRAGAKSLDLFDRPALDDGFGGQLGVGIVDEDDMFGIQVPTEGVPTEHEDVVEKAPQSVQRPDSRMSDRSDSMSYGAPASMAPSGPPSTPGSVPPPPMPMEEDDELAFPPPIQPPEGEGIRRDGMDSKIMSETQNTMILEPLEGPGLERRRKRRKKLGMVIDEVKTLSGEEMKAQLSDTSDIVTTLDLAPPSKKLMNWKKTGGSEKLFALPERIIPSKCLLLYYSRHLITNRIEHEEELPEEEMMNGDLTHRTQPLPLPELDDLDEQLPLMSPIPEQPPKTPKTPSYQRTPPKKKRKTEDKERKTKEQPITNHNHDYRTEESDHFIDQSSIQQARAGSLQINDYQQTQHFPTFQPDEDDEDDYGAPMSVGPPEEMYPDETAEQFEERMRNKRTNILLKFMVNQLEEEGQVLFSNLVRNNRRKQVAQKFFSLLVLKKQMAIELTQNPDISYAEIIITKGHRYDESLSSSIF